MDEPTLGKIFLQELKEEERATRECLERIPIDKLYDYKPHEKSMPMGYLAVLVADILRWIAHTITKGDIDFKTWEQANVKTTKDLVEHFDKCMAQAEQALENVLDEELEKTFKLKNNEQVLFTSTKKETVGSSIRHLVHHRGQLTVYMRLNNIAVPSIYGPSADEKSY